MYIFKDAKAFIKAKFSFKSLSIYWTLARTSVESSAHAELRNKIILCTTKYISSAARVPSHFASDTVWTSA